ncbi:MAG: LysM peptidoglycan-binding domain-containing protein [Bacilli bacterium]|nr:LysM peptidoglycan-binding domain-containing protein [Bacilli bacterium]
MKKIISFEKKIEFPSMIGEVTSISLEHDLEFIDETNIEGMLTVNGTYKLTEASMIEEPFSYELPTEIILTERLDTDSSKIEIDDFYYEIENDYNLICYIDIRVEGVEVVDIEEQTITNEIETNPIELQELDLKIENIDIQSTDNDIRECDGELQNIKEEENNEEIMIDTKETTVTSIFENINESEETYSTYSVYILREEETIQSLISKYKTTKEELEKYNDLTNLTIGTKIIIPLNE